ncbi:MAG TPA: septum formation initiator family protein [Bacteroidota bacterium]|nr:septum formation initiator family protein [Bacteroidota bacterium]
MLTKPRAQTSSIGSMLKSLLRSMLKNKRVTVAVVLAFLFLFYAVFDNKGIFARIRLESQKRDLIQKVKNAEEENKALEAQIHAMEGDKKTIERIAREKYGMARQGETVYRVKKDSD